MRPIRSERRFEICQKLLRLERAEDIAGILGDRLLHQFDPRAIDIVRGLVKQATPDSAPEIRDLKYDLVIVATIMGNTFPEYERWFADAKRDAFGWFGAETRMRIADNFQTDESRKTAFVKQMAADLTARLASDRATREQILQAILHPNPHTRQMAVAYYAKGFLPDPDVLPRIIQAVETYGREACRSLFPHDGLFHQTEQTLDWMIEELKEPRSNNDDRIPYQVVLSRVLAHAPPELLLTRQRDIEQLDGVDSTFQERIARRIGFSKLGPEHLWEQLEALCEAEKKKQYLTEADLPLGYDLAEALARYPDFATPKCLEILALKIDDYKDNPLAWMEGFMVYLAGLLKLSQAVPALLNWLHTEDDWLNPLAMEALTKIGTDSVVELLVEEYPVSGWSYRFSTADILGKIHSDLALMACLSVPDLESDPTIRTQWASSALEQFSPRAIDPARELDFGREG